MQVDIWKERVSWDRYVESNSRACNYHRWGWGTVIEETYGHQPLYLAATVCGEIKGILPLVLIKSWMFGRSLVSVPFFSYGGLLADTDEVRDALLAKGVELGKEFRVRHIELRQGDESEHAWRDVAAKVTMAVQLPDTVEELWERISPKMRKRIRYARNHGLTARWGHQEDVDRFYAVFATNMRNLGTPVYPRSWFQNMYQQFPADIHILTLWDEGQPVAAAWLSSYRNTLELPWAATLPDSRGKFSALLLYWTLLEWAQENGYQKVDLGRCSPGSGNYDFKRRWVCEEKPLHWYYWLAPGTPVPELRHDNPRFKLAVEGWKRLPLLVANRLGPKLVRSLP
jgi:serine/alanine adding enzyme